MKSARLAVGNPTGYHDQYQCTLIPAAGGMLRGPLTVSAIRELAAALGIGYTKLGTPFDATTMKRRKHEATP